MATDDFYCVPERPCRRAHEAIRVNLALLRLPLLGSPHFITRPAYVYSIAMIGCDNYLGLLRRSQQTARDASSLYKTNRFLRRHFLRVNAYPCRRYCRRV